jgi:preprotein translocase subunit SecY
MNQFFEAFANMFRIPDLRKRLLFTLAMLAVYRLGAFLPTPGINTDVLAQFFNQNQGSVLGVIDLFSGGNFRRLTIFALGIMPYITASIILQLMTVPGTPAKRGRTRPAQDHAVHALPDDSPERRAVVFDRRNPAAHGRPEQSAAGL